MNKFTDFDLDIRKVVNTGNDGGVNSITTVTFTLLNKCKSVENPTTGMTSACCKKKKGVDEPQCV